MARGGARPGAGRPRKAGKQNAAQRGSTAAPRVADAPQGDLLGGATASPLDFMLAAINDPKLDIRLRAQMAQAAAPYVHLRAGEVPGGVKAARDARAKEIGASPRFNSLMPPKFNVVK